MRSVRLLLAVLITLLVQLVLANRIDIAGIRPDLTVLLLVFLAYRRGPFAGTLMGFVIGLLLDLLNPQTLGMNMLAKSITGYLVGSLSRTLVVSGLPLLIALAATALLAHDLIFLLAYTRVDLPRTFVLFFTDAVPTAAYTALFAFAILAATTVLGSDRMFAPEEGRARR